MDNRQSDGGYPLAHSPYYDDGCGQRLPANLSLGGTVATMHQGPG